jgi:hypothetical protein
MADSSFFYIMGAFILIGIFAFILMAVRTHASRNWKNTTGIIVESRIEMQRDRNGSIAHPIIVYEYVVDGQRFRSNQIGFGGQSSGTGTGSLVRRYPAGMTVTVYYNPNNPSEAVLSRSALGGMLLLGLILVIFIAIFVHLLQTNAAISTS